VLQAWDVPAGTPFVHAMDQAIQHTRHTLLVLSPAYLRSQMASCSNGVRQALQEATSGAQPQPSSIVIASGRRSDTARIATDSEHVCRHRCLKHMRCTMNHLQYLNR
jgi:hypothetical protein